MRGFLVAVLAVCLSGCLCDRLEGSGKAARETRSLNAFDAVEVAGAFRVHVVVASGPAPRVELEGDDNLLPRVRAQVVASRLVLDLDTWAIDPRLPLVATVRTPGLRAVELNGAIQATVEGVNADELTVEANGSATLTLKGQAGHLALDLNGSTDVDALALTTRRSTVDLAGSGKVAVCATDELRIDVAGSGEVVYACEPDRIEQEIAGSGRVRKQ